MDIDFVFQLLSNNPRPATARPAPPTSETTLALGPTPELHSQPPHYLALLTSELAPGPELPRPCS